MLLREDRVIDLLSMNLKCRTNSPYMLYTYVLVPMNLIQCRTNSLYILYTRVSQCVLSLFILLPH